MLRRNGGCCYCVCLWIHLHCFKMARWLTAFDELVRRHAHWELQSFDSIPCFDSISMTLHFLQFLFGSLVRLGMALCLPIFKRRNLWNTINERKNKARLTRNFFFNLFFFIHQFFSNKYWNQRIFHWNASSKWNFERKKNNKKYTFCWCWTIFSSYDVIFWPLELNKTYFGFCDFFVFWILVWCRRFYSFWTVDIFFSRSPQTWPFSSTAHTILMLTLQ